MPINDNGNWKLTEEDLRVVAYIEECFWTNGTSPPVGNIASALEMDEAYIRELLTHQTINEYLGSRAVTNPIAELVPTEGLTAHQLYLANILLNASDRQSLRQKLKVANVSTQQYYAWLADERFARYMQRRAEQVFGAGEWQIRQSLFNNAADGETAAQKLYFELIGKYSTKVDVNINVEGILSQVVEIVSNYVTSEQSILIARDIEILLQTGTVPRHDILELASVEITG